MLNARMFTFFISWKCYLVNEIDISGRLHKCLVGMGTETRYLIGLGAKL